MQNTKKYNVEEKRKERNLQKKRNQLARSGVPGVTTAFLVFIYSYINFDQAFQVNVWIIFQIIDWGFYPLLSIDEKKTTAADLPEEVVRKEILTRLPIKSVVCFKSVSKSWFSLFSDPQFVKEHATKNPNDYDCLIVQKNISIFILSRYKETFFFCYGHYFLIGSINGLVCISNGKKLSLWNPAIHQSKESTVPVPPHRYCVSDYIGFGFDPASNNYKVVVLSVDKRSATIYCSNSDSWIDIYVPDNVFPKDKAYYSNKPPIIVKNCPYWTLVRYTHNRHPCNSMLGVMVFTSVSLIAVKFNVASNEFNLLPQLDIDTSVDAVRSFHYEFVDMEDCLTLIIYLGSSSKCMVDIYSLHGEDGSWFWSKMYDVGPCNFQARKMFVSPTQGFKYGGEFVFHEDGMFSCYDHKTLTTKRLLGTRFTYSPVFRCFRYMPGLVFLEGMKSVHLMTQNRTPGCCSRTPGRLINSLRD
ncbi:F-box/kelch-repeat protein At3g23880-like [Apium graveolens]|uniref:F-box/kelch-repeat protein At3g23880-like n=1 Tax=Apium graveolens TaxID=4045 RepID=UPI003D7A178D